MPPVRKNAVKFNVWKCINCPNGRSFDTIHALPTSKTYKRSLQHHVAQAHPDFNGDLEEMIGEKIVKDRKTRETTSRREVEMSDEFPDIDLSNMEAPGMNFPEPVVTPSAELGYSASMKVLKILRALENDEDVTIGIDAWDLMAISGQFGDEIREMAEDAFPTDKFDRNYTVCRIVSNDYLLKRMAIYFCKKVERFRASERDGSDMYASVHDESSL